MLKKKLFQNATCSSTESATDKSVIERELTLGQKHIVNKLKPTAKLSGVLNEKNTLPLVDLSSMRFYEQSSMYLCVYFFVSSLNRINI